MIVRPSANVSQQEAVVDREYSLDDLMSDPLTRQLMARDRVDEHQVRALATRVRTQLRSRGSAARRPPEPRSFID